LKSAPVPTPASKSRTQAEAALELLKKGTVTVDQLKQINSKYPSDPVYFIRTVLKQPVLTNRAKDGKTTYSLPGAVDASKTDAGTTSKDDSKDASKTDDEEGELLQAAAA
jgi:hypothetical protein